MDLPRGNTDVVEMGIALLAQSDIAKQFWDDGFVTATFIINQLPNHVLNSLSPFEALFKCKPNSFDLKTFGCLCYPFTRPYNKHKLDFRSCPSTFLGFSSSHKGYIVLLPFGKVIVTRDVIFDENIFPHKVHALNPIPTTIAALQIPPILPTLEVPSPLQTTLPSVASHHDFILSDQSPRPSDRLKAHMPNIEQHSPCSLPTPPPLPAPTEPSKPCHQMVTRSKAGIFKPKTFLIAFPELH